MGNSTGIGRWVSCVGATGILLSTSGCTVGSSPTVSPADVTLCRDGCHSDVEHPDDDVDAEGGGNIFDTAFSDSIVDTVAWGDVPQGDSLVRSDSSADIGYSDLLADASDEEGRTILDSGLDSGLDVVHQGDVQQDVQYTDTDPIPIDVSDSSPADGGPEDDVDGGCVPASPQIGVGPGTEVVPEPSLGPCKCWPDGDFCDGLLDSDVLTDVDSQWPSEFACPDGEVCTGDAQAPGKCVTVCEVSWDCDCEKLPSFLCNPTTNQGLRCPEGYECLPNLVKGQEVQLEVIFTSFGFCRPIPQ